MRKYEISDKLKKILGKLFKRDKKLYFAIFKKMDEILTCADVNAYKNLRKPLQKYKRVHIGSFVFIFSYDEEKNFICFENLKHHDDAYN